MPNATGGGGDDPATLFAEAMSALHAHRPEVARPILERVAALAPDHAKTRYALGVAYSQGGDWTAACAWLQHALDGDLEPFVRQEAVWRLGLAARADGDAATARAQADWLIAHAPAFHGGPALRGALLVTDDPAAAEADLRRALDLDPGFVPAARCLASLLLASDRTAEAVSISDHLTGGREGMADIDRDLAGRVYDAGDLETAVRLLRRLVESADGTDGDRARLVLALLERGDLAGAERLAAGLPTDDEDPRIAFARGIVAYRGGDPAAAVPALAAASAVAGPWRGDALVLSGLLARQRGDRTAARGFYARILDEADGLPPATVAEAEAGLGQLLLDAGEIDAALGRLACAAPPDASLRRHLDRLVGLHYRDRPDAIAEAASAVEASARAAVSAIGPLDLAVAPALFDDRPLRIVYFGDFSRHQVQAFVLPLVRAHDGRRTEAWVVHAAIDGTHRPGLVQGIAVSGGRVEDLTGGSPADLAHAMASLQADAVLHVTANMHAEGMVAAGLLADRPQIAWGDMFGGTGTSAIPHLITDALHLPEDDNDPLAAAAHRMDSAAYPFAPPPDAPAINKPVGRPLTFGSTHRLAKLSDETLERWAGVLAAVPDSMMILQATTLDDVAVAQGLVRRFDQLGVASARLELVGRLDHRAMLDLYNRIDVVLDAQPWSGGLTTLEAMWMGTPVVTLPGRSQRGRHSAAHLTHAGLFQLIADSPEAFRRTAVEIAGDAPGRGLMAISLRDRMRRSELMATREMAADIATIVGEICVKSRSRASANGLP